METRNTQATWIICGYNLQHVSSSYLQQVNPEQVCQKQSFHEPLEGQNSIEFVSFPGIVSLKHPINPFKGNSSSSIQVP